MTTDPTFNHVTMEILDRATEDTGRALAYAACWDHAGDALRATGPDLNHRTLVRNVSGHDRARGLSTYTCGCGKPADVYMRAVVLTR